MRFTPGIKFTNDIMLNEFVVIIEHANAIDREYIDNVFVESILSDDSKIDRVIEDIEKHSDIVRIPYKQLNKSQKNIIQFCSIPRTGKEILEHIGYSYNSANITKQIKLLLQMDYPEMTEPDKPNSKKTEIS